MNTNENAIRKFYRNHSIKGLIGMLSIVAICAANTPAQAMSEGAKCAMKADLLKGDLSLCLSKADANVSKGRSADTRKADKKCHLKFLAGWEKTRVKAQSKDAELGDNCAGRMTDAESRASQASVLAAFERNLEEFGVRKRDLAANSTIRSLIEEVPNATFTSCDEPELTTGNCRERRSSADRDPSASTGLFRGCIPMDTDSDDPGLGNISIHGDEDQPIINDELDDVMDQEYQVLVDDTCDCAEARVTQLFEVEGALRTAGDELVVAEVDFRSLMAFAKEASGESLNLSPEGEASLEKLSEMRILAITDGATTDLYAWGHEGAVFSQLRADGWSIVQEWDGASFGEHLSLAVSPEDADAIGEQPAPLALGFDPTDPEGAHEGVTFAALDGDLLASLWTPLDLSDIDPLYATGRPQSCGEQAMMISDDCETQEAAAAECCGNEAQGARELCEGLNFWSNTIVDTAAAVTVIFSTPLAGAVGIFGATMGHALSPNCQGVYDTAYNVCLGPATIFIMQGDDCGGGLLTP